MLKTSNVFIIINSLAQLYYISVTLPPMDIHSTNSILSHIVAKSFAAISILYLLHSSSSAYFDGYMMPNTVVKVLTAVFFCSLASLSDWVFGECLVYCLVALALGLKKYGDARWSNLPWAQVGVVAVTVAANNLCRCVQL